MYLNDPSARRITPITGQGSFHETWEHVLISEVASYPIGLVMYMDRPSSIAPFGVNISDWSKYSYDQTADLVFEGIPYIEINSQIPADFRTKDEIKDCRHENLKSISNIPIS